MAANMVVRTNVFSLNAHRNMKNVGLEQRRASNRLSSGYRINSAADDAAGLAISENMRAQIRGLDQASRNTQDGQAMILTTEGGLEEIGNMLQRTRELMVQASNDTNTQGQRALIEQEIGQLGREILSMQNRVEFNTNRVLAMGPLMTNDVIKTAAKMDISAQNIANWTADLETARANTIRTIDLLNELDAGATEISGAALEALEKNVGITFTTIIGFGLGSVTAAPTTVEQNVTSVQNTVGNTIAMLNTRLGQITTALEELATTGAGGGAGDIRAALNTSYAAVRSFATANTSGNNIAFFQVGANASQGISFDFEEVSRAVSSAGWITRMIGTTMSAPAAGSGIGNGVRLSPFISMLDSSIDDISRVRANLGAVQNRMDYTMRSLDISSENLQDSESRVRNADVAREMMRFTMTNVLQQAAVSMLAQANQLPQNLLQLLR